MVCFMAAQAAAAVTRYVSPSGSTSPSECTDPIVPCSLVVALDHPASGDSISLASGTYDLQSVVLPPVPLTWTPTDSSTRPVLASAGAGATMSIGIQQSGTVLEGIALRNTHVPGDEPALLVGAGTAATVRNVVIEGGSCVDAPDPGPLNIEGSSLTSRISSTCLFLGPQATVRRSTVGRLGGLATGTPAPSVVTQGLVEDTTVTGGLQLFDARAVARRVRVLGITAIWGQGLVVDSLARSVAGDGVAIAADAPRGGTLRVVNVTAVAPNGVALLSRPVRSSSPMIGPNVLDVTNAIARGGVADVRATAGVSCAIGQFCDFGTVSINHSNFVTRDPVAGSLLAGAIQEGSGNQSGDPRFADAAAGDFHPQTGSPVIDAGVPRSEALPSDLDGRPRFQGPAPDLGAFERDVPPGSPPTPALPPVTLAPSPASPSIASGGASRDTTAPVLGSLRLSRVRFRVGPTRTAVSAARERRRSPAGTTLTTSVNEPALISFTIQRAGAGRRIAGRCVKQTSRRRAARRCTRWIALTPTLTRRLAAADSVRLRFTGRVGSRRLQPGRHRFSAQAVDLAGNRSTPRLATFIVVRR